MASVTAVNCLGGFVHNPRGNIWLNDESSVGHKLLMKMGWSKGKGLGRNEDGIKENLKVKQKSSSSGVGWKDESFFKVQNTEYDSLLKSIGKECDINKGVSNVNSQVKQECGSLELRSQTFRNRLHYRKFVRGKDLSTYSEKDLKSIFILNKPSEENKEDIVQDAISPVEKNSHSEDKLSNLMDTYNSKLSISDYFALKMQGKKNVIKMSSNRANMQSEKLEKENSSLYKTYSVKERKKKVSSVKNIDNLNMINEKLPLPEINPCKKKRKRSADLNSINVSSTNEYKSSELSSDNVSKPHKKKKKVDTITIEHVKSLKDVNEKCLEMNLAPTNSIEILENCLLDNEVSCTKKHKKSKKRLGKRFKALRSCIKSKTGKYSLKNVSFNDNVSYRIIEECIPNSETSSQPECIILDGENDEECVSIEDASDVQEIEVVEQKICSQAETATEEKCNKVEKKPDGGCSLVRKSLIYNSWMESQMQAMKMEQYKSMLENIKQHAILGTSNLLSIPGYGNWGYI